jgi:hypothetical protein
MSQTQQQRTTPAVSIASPNEACASWFLRLCLGSDCRDRGQLTVCLECFEDRSETTTRFIAGSQRGQNKIPPQLGRLGMQGGRWLRWLRISGDAHRSVREDGLANTRLVPAEQLLPPGNRNAAREFRGGEAPFSCFQSLKSKVQSRLTIDARVQCHPRPRPGWAVVP